MLVRVSLVTISVSLPYHPSRGYGEMEINGDGADESDRQMKICFKSLSLAITLLCILFTQKNEIFRRGITRAGFASRSISTTSRAWLADFRRVGLLPAGFARVKGVRKGTSGFSTGSDGFHLGTSPRRCVCVTKDYTSTFARASSLTCLASS